MVRLRDGWSVAAAAQRFQARRQDNTQVARPLPLRGRSGHRGTARAGPVTARGALVDGGNDMRVIELRRRTRRGAGFIAHVSQQCTPRRCTASACKRDVGRTSTTATAAAAEQPKPAALEREPPGELVMLDVHRLPAIPDGGGSAPPTAAATPDPARGQGWRYVHSAIDDRSTPPGVLRDLDTNETGFTAAGFWCASRRLLRRPTRGSPARVAWSAHRQRPLLRWAPNTSSPTLKDTRHFAPGDNWNYRTPDPNGTKLETTSSSPSAGVILRPTQDTRSQHPVPESRPPALHALLWTSASRFGECPSNRRNTPMATLPA